MAKRGRKPGQKGKCGVCGNTGHNARTCPNKSQKAPSKNKKKVKKSKTSKTKPVKSGFGPKPVSVPQPEKVKDNKPVEQTKPKVEFTSFDLDNVINGLLMSEPYFAALSRRINKTKSKAIPTAGVCIDAETMRYEMLYNPDFMGSLNSNNRAGVILHEYFHLSLGHCSSRRDRMDLTPVNPKCPTPQEKAKLFQWNIAADLSINCHIKEKLTGGEFSPCLPGEGRFKDYPEFLSAEEYYNLLSKDEEFQKDMQKQQGQDGEGSPSDGQGGGDPGSGEMKKKYGQMDDHSSWSKDKDGNEVDGSVADIAKESIREAMRKAVSEAAEAQSWGSVSASMRDQIIKSLQGRIDWTKVLRYFIRTSQRADKSGSIRRINKRYAYIHPGKKVNRQAEIMVAIDQSGSVSDAMLAKFFGELNKLASLASFTVVPFDTEVAKDKVYKWKRGQRHKTERVSCGGTCFDAPTDYANEHSFDGMLILTDMEAPQPKRAKCQRMWITDKAHDPANSEGGWGLKPKNGERVIVIPE